MITVLKLILGSINIVFGFIMMVGVFSVNLRGKDTSLIYLCFTATLFLATGFLLMVK